MYTGVTANTEGNQILARIVAGLAAKLFVVDLKLGHRTARLASPTISAEDLVAQLFINVGLEPQGCAFWSDLIHDAFSVTWCRTVCLSSSVRNLKNRNAYCKRTSGFSFSSFVPARKSAQIISRQYPRDLSLPNIKAAASIACSTMGDLTLVQLKIDNLPRLCFLPG
jgi:hypothetical protein